MKNPFHKKEEVKLVSQKHINRRNFISFAGFLGLNAIAYNAWKWLYHSPKEVPGVTAGAHQPLRKALNATELAMRNTFSPNHLVKTYPKSMAAKRVRVNSKLGMMGSSFELAAWRLAILKKDGTSLLVSLDELKALPKTEIVFDFKCVEGWDQVQHWGGVRFIDFVNHYGLQDESKFEYVGLSTPDNKYYVGIDMPSAMHPQTMLAYEMNDQPLLPQHGQPLRLIVPVKYGIKNLKRIGTIAFSNNRPPDYWAERGYDYYSGL
jgi:hypothetical protein